MEKPIHRAWIQVQNFGGDVDPTRVLRVFTYNLLAQASIRREHFPYCSENALKWKSRKSRLLDEVKESKADVLCFQECDAPFYHNFWVGEMEKLGYGGFFKTKTTASQTNTYGVAIFFKSERFQAVETKMLDYNVLAKNEDGSVDEDMDRPNVGLIVALAFKNSCPEDGVIVATTHLFWNPQFEWVRIRQANYLLEEVSKLNHVRKWPLLICGDFNTCPNDLPYNFLTKRDIPEHLFTRLLSPKCSSNNLIEVVSSSVKGALEKGLFLKECMQKKN